MFSTLISCVLLFRANRFFLLILHLFSDKSKAPTYYLKSIPDDPDTQIIVFTAGPPYEDIAFRIVRRPWEYSHRKGFRSTFDRGVLQRKSPNGGNHS